MRTKLASVRTLGVACGLILTAVVMAAAQQAAAPPSPAGKTAEQVYKNIQVLQGTPADQVNSMMRFMAHSLGVECVFCHVQGDFAKDDMDTKKTAREMIAMVFAINKANFKGRTAVTCETCHNGHNEPVNMPPVGDMMSLDARATAPAEAPAPSGLPTADQILAKYVDALGGEAALRKITSRTITATIDRSVPDGQVGSPTHGQAERYQKAPNLSLIVMHMPNNATITSGFDGATAWTQNPRGNVTEAPAADQARAKREMDFYEPLDLKQQYMRLAVRRTDKVGDRDAYVVQGFLQGAPAERLYFDTQTGLLLRKWVAEVTPLGNNILQTDYQDYRDAGGVKFPYTILIADGADNPEHTIVHVQKVDNNTPLDDSKFAEPAPKAPKN